MANSIRLRTLQPRERLQLTEGQRARIELGNVLPIPEKDYEKLRNKPRINGVELVGDLDIMEDIGVEELLAGEIDQQLPPMENLDIEAVFQSVFSDMEG